MRSLQFMTYATRDVAFAVIQTAAVLRHAIGYATKFALDSRYTFRSGRPQWS